MAEFLLWSVIAASVTLAAGGAVIYFVSEVIEMFLGDVEGEGE